MIVFELGLLIDINMCCVLPDDQIIAKKGCLFASKYQYKNYGILWLPQNIVNENTKTAHTQNLW